MSNQLSLARNHAQRFELAGPLDLSLRLRSPNLFQKSQVRIKRNRSSTGRLDRYPSIFRSTQQPVEQREKHVVSSVWPIVMNQMMFTAKMQPRRKPAADVNAPVHLFDSDDVHRESNENSRADSQLEQHFRQERDDHAIEHKSRENQWRRAAKVQVFKFLRRPNRSVMKLMKLAQVIVWKVQQVAMIKIFKRVRPNEPDDKTGQPMYE